MTRLVNYKLVPLAIGLLLSTVSQTALGQFVVAPPLNQHEYVELVEVLHEQVAKDLNEVFDLPRQVKLTSGKCGRANAFYSPASEGKTSQIVLCEELIGAIIRQAQSQSDGQSQQRLGVFAQMFFILFHEVGHALIDVLDLPAVGQEEDAVDQLATLFFAEEPILAMWAAVFWGQSTNMSRGRFVSMGSFADQHDLTEQRFFNIVCWTYGADPLVRGYVAEKLRLPAQRAQSCQQEYTRMQSAWEHLLGDYLKSSTVLEVSQKRNASGYWRFVESMNDLDMQVRCTASGTLALWQIADQVSGSMSQEGSCVSFGIPTDNTAAAEISSGRVTESAVAFDIAHCHYEGSFEDEDRTAILGSVVCIDQSRNQTLELKGAWHAVR